MMYLVFPILLMVIFGVALLMWASYWKLFEKAGREGWEGILPFYNIYVMLVIIGKPTYWMFLFFIPIINIFFIIRTLDLFVKCFGKDTTYTIGCIILPVIFIPALAFSDAEFQDPFDWNGPVGKDRSDFV